MKKMILVLVLLFAAAALYAQDFSSLPSGSWNDNNSPKWNGTWTFSASGITIKDNDGGGSVTFTTRNVKDIKAARIGSSAGISFSSDDTGKTYRFAPNLTDGTMTIQITKDDGETYEKKMTKQ